MIMLPFGHTEVMTLTLSSGNSFSIPDESTEREAPMWRRLYAPIREHF